ncbi:GGDEF domain-containing protein [Caulobacter sp. 17J65-9]|uniref:GGDEF domain-containing protein n=1 Tax=Caulobacter sp. 17J65-9 TaxID=2709382 RepID=UPI0013C9B444|nr:GGDEF domain-containing protein [Caulobacter sp. 17J65-9]NEX93892.1 GGDEF domain-containing protein [Caulobacter sp. 17J65-9]
MTSESVRSQPVDTDDVRALRAEVERLRAEVAELKVRAETAEALADHDPLVPVLNRRAFMRELQRVIGASRRYGTKASLLYLDLDGFKSVNDSFGHPAGDAALKWIGELLTNNLRDSDWLGRLGGDEFGVLMLYADEASAKAKAAVLTHLIAAGGFDWDGVPVPLGGSFGVRALVDQTDAEQWLAEADAAMFVRKRSR